MRSAQAVASVPGAENPLGGPPARVAALEVTNLQKRFHRAGGTVVKAVDELSLRVEPGEFVVLLGPSGCGKTTLLRSVAGLEHPDAGKVSIGGQTVFDSERGINAGPEHRNFSMVFQSYALWPHMSVFNNVAYPLRNGRPRPSRSEIREQVNTALQQVGIPELADQYPNQISGGQQQRVALARAVVKGDDLVLFDEPLSNVDAKVRDQLRYELLAMQDRLGFAALYVTHDQTEALQLADRVAVLGEGSIRHLGPPGEVYSRPASPYVANFVGTANTLQGRVVTSDASEVVVETTLGRVVGSPPKTAELVEGDDVMVMWRPERTATSSQEGATNSWSATLVRSSFMGSYIEDLYRLDELWLLVWRSESSGGTSDGDTRWLTVEPADIRVLKQD